MKICWDFEPMNRPTFSEITQNLINIAKKFDPKLTIENNEENKNLNIVPQLQILTKEIELEEKFSKTNIDLNETKNENKINDNNEIKIEIKNEIKEEIKEKNIVRFDSNSYLMKFNNLFKVKFFLLSGKKKSKI
jgi:hypothetical protein